MMGCIEFFEDGYQCRFGFSLGNIINCLLQERDLEGWTRVSENIKVGWRALQKRWQTYWRGCTLGLDNNHCWPVIENQSLWRRMATECCEGGKGESLMNAGEWLEGNRRCGREDAPFAKRERYTHVLE